MEVPVLVFRESLLSPWAQRPQSRRGQLSDASPRFQTVGSLDAVNAQVGREGLQKRVVLPRLVVETADESMPPKRRVVGGVSHALAKHRPKSSTKKEDGGKGGGGGATRKTEEKEKPQVASSLPTDQGREATKTSFIELATFPGYTPSFPTPLPHGLDTLEQMKRVTRAQAKLAAKREGYRDYWRENFYSPASQTIFLDTFWWFFLERYQPNRSVQSSLFSRVAENYVKFLAKSEVHTWKDKFLKAYPDAISQCVYTAFIHAFPASWSNFDDSFKMALVEVVYLWQAGTKPLPETWKKWDFEILDPPNSLKFIGKEEQLPKSPKQAKKFNLDMLVEQARAAEREKEEEKEEKELKVPEIRLNPSSRSQSGRTTPHGERSLTSLPGQSDQKSGEREWQRDRQLQTRGPPDSAALSAQGQTENGKLEAARTQYMKLKEERMATRNQRVQGGKTLPVPSSQPSRTATLPRESQKEAVTHQPKTPHTLPSGAPLLPSVPASSNGRGGYKPQMSSPSQKVAPSSRLAGPRRAGGEQGNSVGARKGQGTSAEPPPNPQKPTKKLEGDKDKGGKSEGKTWKEKALQLREKSGQNAISILHKLQHQETPMAVPVMEHVCFDVHGQSPLVRHYLQKKKLDRDTGYAILTKRTEVNQPPPSDAPTYEEVIRESVRESKARSLLFTAQRRQTRQQLQKIVQDRIKKRAEYKEKLRVLLSAQKEVESLSNELVAYWESEGVDRRQGMASLRNSLDPDLQNNIASYITKAFQRLSSEPTK